MARPPCTRPWEQQSPPSHPPARAQGSRAPDRQQRRRQGSGRKQPPRPRASRCPGPQLWACCTPQAPAWGAREEAHLPKARRAPGCHGLPPGRPHHCPQYRAAAPAQRIPGEVRLPRGCGHGAGAATERVRGCGAAGEHGRFLRGRERSDSGFVLSHVALGGTEPPNPALSWNQGWAAHRVSLVLTRTPSRCRAPTHAGPHTRGSGLPCSDPGLSWGRLPSPYSPLVAPSQTQTLRAHRLWLPRATWWAEAESPERGARAGSQSPMGSSPQLHRDPPGSTQAGLSWTAWRGPGPRPRRRRWEVV